METTTQILDAIANHSHPRDWTPIVISALTVFVLAASAYFNFRSFSMNKRMRDSDLELNKANFCSAESILVSERIEVRHEWDPLFETRTSYRPKEVLLVIKNLGTHPSKDVRFTWNGYLTFYPTNARDERGNPVGFPPEQKIKLSETYEEGPIHPLNHRKFTINIRPNLQEPRTLISCAIIEYTDAQTGEYYEEPLTWIIDIPNEATGEKVEVLPRSTRSSEEQILLEKADKELGKRTKQDYPAKELIS